MIILICELKLTPLLLSVHSMQRRISPGSLGLSWSPADNPDTGYVVVDPWEDYKDVRTGGGWMTTFITKNEHADRAIQLINYFLDPDEYTQFGVRGEKDSPLISEVEGPHYYMGEEGWPHYTAAYLAGINSGEYNRDDTGAGSYHWFNSSALANVLYWEKEEDPLYDHFNRCSYAIK